MSAAEKLAGAVVEELRSLVRVVVIDDIIKHPNADALELAIVGGWQCCVKIGEFLKGELAVYCEIDAMLPTSVPEFTFLEERKDSLKQVGDAVYARIKTIRLRKELSQGLLIPLPTQLAATAKVDDDLTVLFGVLKYDPVDVTTAVTGIVGDSWIARLARWISGGDLRSNLSEFPQFIPKSDQRRVQNCSGMYNQARTDGELFESTYKLCGASMTAWVDEYVGYGIASRNNTISLVDDQWGKVEQIRRWVGNLLMMNRRLLRIKRFIFPRWVRGVFANEDMFVRAGQDIGLEELLNNYYSRTGNSIAVQGELCGPGIESNFEQLPHKRFFVYSVYIYIKSKGVYEKALPELARNVVAAIGLEYVPVYHQAMSLPTAVKDCLNMAEGVGAFKPSGYREGLVFKSITRHFSFKAISNSYLLKVEN